MKKYTEIMEHVRPTDCQKNKMLEKAFEGSSSPKKHKFKLKYSTVLLAAAMIFSTTTVFADEIKEVFYNLLGKNEIVSEDVLNEVFSDDDGHVKITVKELLSDGVNSYAIVEYSALDDIGKWWIDKPLVVGSEEDVNMHINYPDLEPNGYSSYSHGVEELEEYHTENSRVFRLTCNSTDKNSNSVKLVYTIHDKWRNEVVLDVSESVEVKDVKIDNSLDPEKYYEPLGGYKISPLGLLIYGNDLGIVEAEDLIVVHPLKIDSLYLVMKDGKKYSLCYGDTMTSYLAASDWFMACDDPGDMTIYQGRFNEPMDIDTIAGIELDGVYYPIDEEIQ